jgi:hypothetical protein
VSCFTLVIFLCECDSARILAVAAIEAKGQNSTHPSNADLGMQNRDYLRGSLSEASSKGLTFGRQRLEGVKERDGLRMHFAGWSYFLEGYRVALEEAGFAITSLREPVPELDDGRNHTAPWLRMPLFLWLKARPVGQSNFGAATKSNACHQLG